MTTYKAPTYREIESYCFTAEEQSEFRAKFPTLSRYEGVHPVGRNTHTGGWGYHRVYDSLDLSQCRFPTKARAKAARKYEYEHRFGIPPAPNAHVEANSTDLLTAAIDALDCTDHERQGLQEILDIEGFGGREAEVVDVLSAKAVAENRLSWFRETRDNA